MIIDLSFFLFYNYIGGNMKKIIVFLIIILLTGCDSNDNIRFMREYEKDNETLYKVDVPEDNYIKYINEEKLTKLLDGGTGIVYVGNEMDDDCRKIVNILFDAVSSTGADVIYYYRTMELDFISKYVDNPQVPIVLFIYDGELTYVMGKLSDKELYESYLDGIHVVLNDICNEECND